jgi:hypothetical protein
MAHRGIFNGYYALRFKIFQRDKFTCQYCGQKAPDVKLEVDHIKEASNGGGDEESNLITSCWACNKGKSSLSIIDKWTDIKERGENPFKDNPSAPTPRRDLLIKILTVQPGLSTKEIALKMNVSKEYSYAITSRYQRQGLINRIKRAWFLAEQSPMKVGK